MRTLYIDKEFKCHTTYSEGLREVIDTTGFFEGKCKEFVEGFLFIPVGEIGIINGNPSTAMIAPWKDYNTLERAQKQYELAQYEAALSAIEKALGVTS